MVAAFALLDGATVASAKTTKALPRVRLLKKGWKRRRFEPHVGTTVKFRPAGAPPVRVRLVAVEDHAGASVAHLAGAQNACTLRFRGPRALQVAQGTVGIRRPGQPGPGQASRRSGAVIAVVPARLRRREGWVFVVTDAAPGRPGRDGVAVAFSANGERYGPVAGGSGWWQVCERCRQKRAVLRGAERADMTDETAPATDPSYMHGCAAATTDGCEHASDPSLLHARTWIHR